MNQDQNKMKAELIEAIDIITEKEREEEGLGLVPMEEEREELYFNLVYTQVPPSASATPNKTIFNTMLVLGMNVEPTITFDYKLNEPTIPNLQQDVHY